MNLYMMTDAEIALYLAQTFKKWRMDPRFSGMTQARLSEHSGVSLTSIKRFEKTGNITISNFIALMRSLNLLESLESLIPEINNDLSPLEILEREQKSHRTRAPRKK